MTRKSNLLAGGIALVAAVLLVSVQVVSQEKGTPQSPGGDEMEQMMAKWKAVGLPGEHHKSFHRAVGKWDTLTRCWWSGPDSEPVVTKGTAEFEVIMGGRFLVQHAKGVAMGQPFEGMGIEGYDNFKKKYVSVWFDSMGTAIYMFTGTPDKSGKVITYYGKVDDPVTGEKDKTVRSVGREVGDDKYVFEMYDKTPDGRECLTMEITYTRDKPRR